LISKTFLLTEIAQHIGAELFSEVPPTHLPPISGLAPLQEATKTALSFYTNPSYRSVLLTTQAGGVILAEQDAIFCKVPRLVMANPYLGYARASTLFAFSETPYYGIHPSAWIAADAVLGHNVVIGPHSVIESAVRIGDGVIIGPNCVVERDSILGSGTVLCAQVTIRHHSIIGAKVRIDSGAVIGSDGFGHANQAGKWIKIAQLGRVIVQDQVEIGANTTIDRGALGDTVIEEGVKLDNLIQIAHNVRIGAHTAIAACVGIAGSATIGRYCAIGGGVGIVGHIEIADRVQITGGSTVLQSIDEPGVYSSGTPLQPTRHWQRNYQRLKQLDELTKRVQVLERLLSSDDRKSTL